MKGWGSWNSSIKRHQKVCENGDLVEGDKHFFISLKIFWKRTSKLTILTSKIHFFVDRHNRAKLSYKIWTVNEETKKLGLVIKCSCQVMNQPLPIVWSAAKNLFIRNYKICVIIKVSVKMNHTGVVFETIFKNKK